MKSVVLPCLARATIRFCSRSFIDNKEGKRDWLFAQKPEILHMMPDCIRSYVATTKHVIRAERGRDGKLPPYVDMFPVITIKDDFGFWDLRLHGFHDQFQIKLTEGVAWPEQFTMDKDTIIEMEDFKPEHDHVARPQWTYPVSGDKEVKVFGI